MYNLFKDLVAATNNVAKLGDIGDRVIGVQIGKVTDVEDPEHLRRIKVELEAYPGQSTDWLECYAPIVNSDPPLPKLGQLTMVQFINGDPHRGIWQGVKIDPELNPSYDQSDPRYDRTDSIEGDTAILCGGNYLINCLETLQFNINNDSSFTLEPNGKCTLANQHSNLILSPSGSSTLANQHSQVTIEANGNCSLANDQAKITLNNNGKIELKTSGTTIDLEPNSVKLNTNSLQFNSTSLTINGVSVVFTATGLLINGRAVAMVGGLDTAGNMTLN